MSKSKFTSGSNHDGRASVAVIGCGATALYFLKHIVNSRISQIDLTFFSATHRFGAGMPYSPEWVGLDNLANIACNEIPSLETPAQEWFARQSDRWLADHHIDRQAIGDSFIPTRAVLGLYLEAQFDAFVTAATNMGISVRCMRNVTVHDVKPLDNGVAVAFGKEMSDTDNVLPFDYAVLATGHCWPGEVSASPRLMSSPWPISKLQTSDLQNIALLGTSLSAVDACLSLARQNGRFQRDFNGRLRYVRHKESADFKVTMHSRKGLLPTLRFHFEYPQFELYSYITRSDLHEHISNNDNHLSLDFLFEQVVKAAIQTKAPELYDIIALMRFEEFAAFLMDTRKTDQPFELLRLDYATSSASIRERTPIFWKEVLDDITYMLNFYTKYLDPVDMLRVRDHLMPLISYLVAVLPQQSCEQLLAMHEANCLSVGAVGTDWLIRDAPEGNAIDLAYNDSSTGKPTTVAYDLIVDCRGQKAMRFEDFPFRSLVETGMVTPARMRLAFPSDANPRATELPLGGVDVDDTFHPISRSGQSIDSLFVLAAPLLNGIYPYHSGLPFCNEITRIAAGALHAEQSTSHKSVRVG